MLRVTSDNTPKILIAVFCSLLGIAICTLLVVYRVYFQQGKLLVQVCRVVTEIFVFVQLVLFCHLLCLSVIMGGLKGITSPPSYFRCVDWNLIKNFVVVSFAVTIKLPDPSAEPRPNSDQPLLNCDSGKLIADHKCIA